MGFKLKKLNLDLELDLTAYIPGEAGKINATKTAPEDLFAWMRHCTKIGGEVTKIQADMKMSEEKKLDITREKLISQIDFLYEKGQNYWMAIPYSLLTDIIKYIREVVNPAEKK